MMYKCPFLVRLAALFSALVLVACGGEKKRQASSAILRFSAIPDQNSTELQEKFDQLAGYLEEKLGVEVKYVPSSDYKASVEMFKNGDIQLAWFGGLTGVQARAAVEGAEAIAQGKEDPAYLSYFIAHKDAGIEVSDSFPAAIGEKSFTFGSESSTSGRLMPVYFIRKETGKTVQEFFKKTPGFSGSHDKTAKLVESGQVEAGVLSYKTFDKLVASGEVDPELVKIIWKTPPYADYNFTAHPLLEEMFGKGFTMKLQDALVALKDPELLAAFPREALISAKSADFDGIVKVASELGFLR